jgi:endonuclease/exonuclease/phosphatase family metal-dependent hydrolase
MRIVSYNILSGGVGRLDPIAETLLYLDGDIIALTEANDPDGTAYLARRYGCEYMTAESPTSPFNVALLSRWPIEQAINLAVRYPNLSRAAMEAIIATPTGPLRIITVHLASGLGAEKEQQRLAEFRPIVNHHATGDLPTVIAGDLNTNSPNHPVDVDAAEPEVRRRLTDDPELIRHDLVVELTDAGWVDVLAANHHPGPPHTFSTGWPATRLDYILADPRVARAVVGAGVETGGFTPYCSDHFPIWADLDLETLDGR